MIKEYYKWNLRPNITPADVIKNQRSKKMHLVKHIFRDIYSNRQINR